MKILAFDVSITGCAVAIFDGENGFWNKNFLETDRGQAEMLIPMIEDIIQKAGWTMQDLNRIAITQGPGSFTGVRIGLATARSLGLALDIPVFGMSTLELIRAEHEPDMLVLVDTKRGDYYGCVGHEAPRLWSELDVEAYKGSNIKNAVPNLRILSEKAIAAKMEDGFINNPAPNPIYLRNAEISQPKDISKFI